MANKNVQLLLTENVDNLGIVGDVVNVRLGYARNFLLPRGYATTPSEELLKDLAAKRAEAEKEVAALRAQREQLIGKIDGLEITMVRSVNDQGMLYGSVSQQDLAEGLTELGFPVKPREIRLPFAIKRIGNYEVTVKFATDLEAEIKVHVEADRELEGAETQDMEFDDEGNLVTAEEAAKLEERAKARADRPRKNRGGDGEGDNPGVVIAKGL